MRFLIICLLFSLSLSGQADMEYDAKYVWAKSGLTIRAEGRANAEKIGVLPLGAKVMPTGRLGEWVKVEALPATSYEWGDEHLESDAYVMNERYIQVTYGKDTGYVYNGYLSYYPCFPSGDDQAEEITFGDWLTFLGGIPDTAAFMRRLTDYGRTLVIHHKNGIVTTIRDTEGGGSYLLAFPAGSINEGYLIAERFFGVTFGVTNKEDVLESRDFVPQLLSIEENGTLYFIGDLEETKIYVVEGMLFIYTERSVQ